MLEKARRTDDPISESVLSMGAALAARCSRIVVTLRAYLTPQLPGEPPAYARGDSKSVDGSGHTRDPATHFCLAGACARGVRDGRGPETWPVQ